MSFVLLRSFILNYIFLHPIVSSFVYIYITRKEISIIPASFILNFILLHGHHTSLAKCDHTDFQSLLKQKIVVT